MTRVCDTVDSTIALTHALATDDSTGTTERVTLAHRSTFSVQKCRRGGEQCLGTDDEHYACVTVFGWQYALASVDGNTLVADGVDYDSLSASVKVRVVISCK